MGSGRINVSRINRARINGTDFQGLIENGTLGLVVNLAHNSRLNSSKINTFRINAPSDNPAIAGRQTYIVSVENGTMTMSSSSPVPVMTYLAKIESCVMTMSSSKIFAEQQAIGGKLFVTVSDPEGTTYRFAFEGIKA